MKTTRKLIPTTTPTLSPMPKETTKRMLKPGSRRTMNLRRIGTRNHSPTKNQTQMKNAKLRQKTTLMSTGSSTQRLSVTQTRMPKENLIQMSNAKPTAS
jgi:hypothetical protein